MDMDADAAEGCRADTFGPQWVVATEKASRQRCKGSNRTLVVEVSIGRVDYRKHEMQMCVPNLCSTGKLMVKKVRNDIHVHNHFYICSSPNAALNSDDGSKKTYQTNRSLYKTTS